MSFQLSRQPKNALLQLIKAGNIYLLVCWDYSLNSFRTDGTLW